MLILSILAVAAAPAATTPCRSIAPRPLAFQRENEPRFLTQEPQARMVDPVYRLDGGCDRVVEKRPRAKKPVPGRKR